MAADNFLSRVLPNDASEYSVRDGNVMYLDSKPLKRSFSMPKSHMAIAAIFVVAACAISWFVIDNTLFAAQRAAAASQQAVIDNVQRPGGLEALPNMVSLINLDDEDIQWTFDEAGYTTLDYGAIQDADGFMRWRIPDDMSAEEAETMLSRGINMLPAEEASKILCGSWYYANNRDTLVTMVVRYSDFSTGDPQVAVNNAVAQQGFDLESVTDSGVDDSGNTYMTGTTEYDGTECTWRVSALPLDDIYSIAGLPEEATYVGIRVTEIV